MSRELLNEEVFRKALLKPEIYERLEEKVDYYIDTYQANDKKLGEIGNEFLGKERAIFYYAKPKKMPLLLFIQRLLIWK